MLSQEKFETLILDPNKFVEGDIIWDKNKRNPPAFEFRVKIVSDESIGVNLSSNPYHISFLVSD